MLRAEVAEEIGLRLDVLLTEVGLSPADEAGALKEPIDDALRAMGYAEDDVPTAAPEDPATFIAMVLYWTLRRALFVLQTRFDASLPGGLSASQNQVTKNVERLLVIAEKEAVALNGAFATAEPRAVGIDLNTRMTPCGAAEWG